MTDLFDGTAKPDVTQTGRIDHSTGSRFEEMFGFSRAVRVGSLIAVAGCTAVTPTGVVGPGDIRQQTSECLRKIGAAVEAVGGSRADVIRTRFYVVDLEQLEEIGRLHREFFAPIRPASSIVQVSALALPTLLVEIEADAVLQVDPGRAPHR